MPTIITKLIDKAKPRFSFHHNSSSSASSTEGHHSKFNLANNLPSNVLTTHLFGYKDGTKDDYIEPPPVPPTEIEPIKEIQNASATPTPITLPKDKTLVNPEHLPSTPPRTPGGSIAHHNLGLTNTAGKNEMNHASKEGSNNDTNNKSASATSLMLDDSDVTRPQCQMKLDNFILHRTLGTGSFGRVHLIQSKINKRYYALKVLKKAEIVKLKQVDHTNNERAILNSIQHPFIVNLWGSFQDCANLYMVMDYVPGGELFSLLRKSKKFSNDIARFYAGEVLLALAYLHSKDIIYRDLKPENLLLDPHGHIKICDFGFAKKVPDITWTLCGTPDYLAPEIIQTKGYGKAADYWALGILIYEMLAGYPPFYDDNQFKLYEKILTTQPKYPSSIDSNAKDLLKHLLTRDLSERYGNLKRGYLDISEHKWFAPLDFEKLIQRKIKPPHIPHLKGPGDAANFDKYPEDFHPYGVPQDDPYHDQFPGF